MIADWLRIWNRVNRWMHAIGLIECSKGYGMNFLKKLASGFTTRGRALAQVEQGMAFAKKNDSGSAIKRYTDVVDSLESPRDVVAMAMFNRALVYTAVGKNKLAKHDLKAVLAMPETMTKIKKSASDKLARMERKLIRDGSPIADKGGK